MSPVSNRIAPPQDLFGTNSAAAVPIQDRVFDMLQSSGGAIAGAALTAYGWICKIVGGASHGVHACTPQFVTNALTNIINSLQTILAGIKTRAYMSYCRKDFEACLEAFRVEEADAAVRAKMSYWPESVQQEFSKQLIEMKSLHIAATVAFAERRKQEIELENANKDTLTKNESARAGRPPSNASRPALAKPGATATQTAGKALHTPPPLISGHDGAEGVRQKQNPIEEAKSR